jgi:uncharacterized metal-binding protein
VPPAPPIRRGLVAPLAVGVYVVGIASAVYWRTAYPTITWWDSASYSLAAATLGVTSSPGSLMLTLLGWLVTRIPWGLTTARVLSLLAGVIVATMAGLVYVAALRLIALVRTSSPPTPWVTSIGAGLGALTLAFSASTWEYATQFSPYSLTAAFTALILLTMLWWWRVADTPGSWRALAVLTLLFGLDFSVHRTNALLIPSAVAWILVRHPHTSRRLTAWLAGAGGLIAGLSFQLLVMPIAATTDSPVNMYEPSTWARFWDYVSLAQVGGGFLVNVWPRNASVWSVQIADLLSTLGDTFFHIDGPLSVLGLVPGVAAVGALVTVWRRDRRLGAAWTLVLLLQATMTVLYFNIPANYFRSLHRHYLPVLVTVGVVAASGMGLASEAIRAAIARRSGRLSLGLASGAAVGLVLAPVSQLARNWTASDASRRWFTRDYAANALTLLPENAIYFTVGDNDTFPLWYVQTVEGVRRDVTVVNTSLANADWYIDQIASRRPSFPVRSFASVPKDSNAVTIPVSTTAERLGLPPGTPVPNAVAVRPVPQQPGSKKMLPADWVMLDLARKNEWRLPLAISTTASADGLGWFAPYARFEGLFWRVVPVEKPAPDLERLRTSLGRYELRGYAGSSVQVGDVSRNIGGLYVNAYAKLLDLDTPNECGKDLQSLFARVPPARVGYAPADVESIRRKCENR